MRSSPLKKFKRTVVYVVALKLIIQCFIIHTFPIRSTSVRSQQMTKQYHCEECTNIDLIFLNCICLGIVLITCIYFNGLKIINEDKTAFQHKAKYLRMPYIQDSTFIHINELRFAE